MKLDEFSRLKQKAYHGLVVFGDYELEGAKRLTDFDELRRTSAIYSKVPIVTINTLRQAKFKPEVAIACDYVYYMTFLRPNSHFYLEVTSSDNSVKRAFLFSSNVEVHKQILLEMGIEDA